MFETTDKRKTNRLILGRIWQGWIQRYRGQLAGTIVLMAFVAATAAAYPLLTKYIFNALADGRASDVILYAPPIIILLALFKGGALFAQTIQVNKLALRVTTDLQKDMAKNLIKADLAVVTKEPAGTFMSRIMNDLNLVREAFVRLANNLVRDMLTVIVLMGAMIYLDWLMTLIVAVVYPVAIQPIIRIGNRQRKASGSLQSHMEGVTSLLAETLQGARLVKAYQMETTETKRTATAFDGLFARLVALLTGRALIDPILEVIGGLAVGGVVALAGWRVVNGDMQVGDVIAFITTLIMLVQPVRGIGTLNAVTQEALVAAERILSLLDIPRKIIDAPDATDLVINKGGKGGKVNISFDKVGFAYGNEIALSDVSFQATVGQIVALVGPSGAGKTTIINLLPRFYDVSAGTILVNGQDIRKLTIESLRMHIALVSQDAILFEDTVAANIGFGRRDASKEEIIAAAKDAAAHDFIISLPDGYQTQVGVMGNRLSGGQRQRISIARAMLKDAPILLLDEATAALDAESEKQVQTALERLQKGRTTLVVAHRLATVRNADMILVMDDGGITQTGKHDDLIVKNGLYARLCELQFFTDKQNNREPDDTLETKST